MAKKKKIRTRGKLSFSEYFKKLKEGDNVAIKREPFFQAVFPKRMQGRTGVVIGKRGKSYITKVKDLNEEKIFIIEAIHLKKLNFVQSTKK